VRVNVTEKKKKKKKKRMKRMKKRKKTTTRVDREKTQRESEHTSLKLRTRHRTHGTFRW
jgi:hypothetical protein